jgi:hypothetical protein
MRRPGAIRPGLRPLRAEQENDRVILQTNTPIMDAAAVFPAIAPVDRGVQS